MTRVIVLGSTGSIGTSTLDIIRNKPDLFKVAALSARSNTNRINEQVREFHPDAVAMTDPAVSPELPDTVRLYNGPENLLQMIRVTDADIVVNGIAGAAGMRSSFAAVESGKRLALANKETIVMTGRMLLEYAVKKKIPVIPVDSEHSAIFHLIGNDRKAVLDEIILTASGGAFRDLPADKLERVKPADALKHPNWDMGPKITIDSATMANKALEVIEAYHLFGLPLEAISVVIHPQSYVHSMIRTHDGSLFAQISKPDMRIPIQNALTWPEMLDVGYGRLDIRNCTLEFRPVDTKKYPLLELGYAACAKGGAYPLVFNAANEEAVAAFIEGKIRYLDISDIVEQTLSLPWQNLNSSVDDVIFNDTHARHHTLDIIRNKR